MQKNNILINEKLAEFKESIRTKVRELCLASGTPVTIRNEKGLESKPIENIRKGDVVLSCRMVFASSDSVIAESCEDSEVLEVYHQTSDTLVNIFFDGRKLRATPEHPFYVLNQEQWVFAEKLQPGDELLTSTGESVLIEKIEPEYGKFEVHNLKVKDNHTYYADNILVHNCDLEAELAARIARRAESLNSPLVIAATAVPAAAEIVAPAIVVPAAAAVSALAINRLVCDAVGDEAAAQNTLSQNSGDQDSGASNLGPNTQRFGSVQEFIETTAPGTQTRSTRVLPREAPGGFSRANQDFDKLVDTNSIVNRQNGLRTGRTVDGNYEINVRPESRDGRATIEIIRSQYDRIKVRYNE